MVAMVKRKIDRDELNSHTQLTLDEVKQNIERVLGNLYNLEEDEGGGDF